MSDWTVVKLADCGHWFSGGTPSKSNSEYWIGEIPWVSPKDMDQRFIIDAEDHVSRYGVEHGSRLIPKDSILFVVRSMTLANRFQIAITRREVAFNQDLKAIVCHSNVFPDFLFYAISAKSKYILDSLVDEASHGTKRLKTEAIGNLDIALPPLAEQHAIADILGSLDDKIELNRRMNETLEEIAHTIFKSWFIDFDPVHAKSRGEQPPGMDAATAALFPDHFEDSELGPIPTGWDTRLLISGLDLIGGGTPKTAIDEYWNGDIPWYSVKDVPPESDIFVIDTEKKITRKGLDNSSTKILPELTTIISARGTVGKLALVGTPMAMNQSCYGVRGKDYPAYFTYFLMRFAVNDLLQRTHGTVFDTITRETFSTIDTVFPSLEAAHLFDREIKPLLDRIKSNLHETQLLAKTRDVLLPKLISGEVRVGQIATFEESIA